MDHFDLILAFRSTSLATELLKSLEMALEEPQAGTILRALVILSFSARCVATGGPAPARQAYMEAPIE